MTGFPEGCALHHATATDLAEYGRISRGTFTDTYRASHDADALARHVEATFTDERLLAELNDPRQCVLAATHGGRWVGYALLQPGSSPDGVGGRDPVELGHFYVEAAWHGRGVATPLIEAALDLARERGHDMAWLAVWAQNSRAIRFYERRGFAIVGRATYLFDGLPEHDHVMAIAL